jgi:hypothetical protein
MAPIVPIIIAAGAFIGLAAASRGKKKVPPGSAEDTSEVGRVYRQAMDPAMRDLAWMRQAVAFLNSKGQTELAGNVSSRIASLQANAAAEAAARQQAEAARTDWEARAGGAPTQEQLDRVWQQFQSGEIDNNKPLLQFAFSMFTVYGTPERARAVQAAIDRLDGIVSIEPGAGGAAGTTPAAPPEPPAVVVDEQQGTVTPVAPETPPVGPPPSPPPATPPTAPPTGGVERPPTGGVVAPTPPTPTPAEPELPEHETQPLVDPNGTVALARTLIADEAKPNWKTLHSAAVKVWQRKMGTEAVGTADGLFGPKSALGMAHEVGVLPRIRYWSKKGGTLQQQLGKFRDNLYTLAANLDQQGKHEHAAALRVSGEAETGQGWPSKPAPIPAEQRAEEALDIAQAIQTAAGEQLADLKADFPWLRELLPT